MQPVCVSVPTNTQLNASDDHRTFRILIKYMHVCEYFRGRYNILLLYMFFFLYIHIVIYFLHAHNIMVIRASTYYIGIVYLYNVYYIYTAVSFTHTHNTRIYVMRVYRMFV